MKPFNIVETYNSQANKMIECMLSEDYYNYIINNIKEMENFKFRNILYDNSNNKIYTDLEYNISLDVPEWVKKISKTNSYFTIEKSIYDLCANTVEVKVIFPNLPVDRLVEIKYTYMLINTSQIECKKIYTIQINCLLPLLKNPIESLIKKIILQKTNLKYKMTTQYLTSNNDTVLYA